MALIVGMNFGTSVQVLGEFYDHAGRKAKLAIPDARLKELIRRLKARPLVEETVELFDRAVAIAERYGIRYYDAAILAAAQELGAAILYTEGLSDGQDYDGVKVINPFRGLG